MFKDKTKATLERTLAEKKTKALAWSERVLREEKAGLSVELRREAINIANKYRSEVEALEKALTTGDTFVDQNLEYKGYFENTPVEPIAKNRFRVDTNRSHYLIGGYNIVSSADEVSETGTGTPTDINELVNTVKTNSDESIIIDDYLLMSEDTYDDDTENANIALDSIHDARVINAENKAVLRTLITAKESSEITVDTVISTINAKLCAKSKRNAVIFTNNSGFAKLDITSSGVALIKRVNGEFVFAEKYTIKEFDNDILPNNADGSSPILIGDFDNIVKIGVATMREYDETDIVNCVKNDRRRLRIIPTIVDTTDTAYLNGKI